MAMIPICKTEQQKQIYWKTFDRQRWQFLRSYEERMRDAVIEQSEPILTALNDGISNALAQIDTVSKRPIQRAFTQLYSQVGVYYAKRIFSGLKSHYGFETKNQDDIFLRQMQAWVELKGADLVVNITDNTKAQLKAVLQKGIKEGLGTDEIARQIRDSGRIGGLKRGKVIARTEIIRASNLGSISGARSTNLELRKEWIATRDDRTRETHSALDGQIVDLDKPFNVGGFLADFPSDAVLPAGESINCRCTQAYIPV